MVAESLALDRVDRQILHALQISPRAPFARMATALDVSEQTVARRYQRMRTNSVVRVTALPEPGAARSTSWTLRIGCRPGTALGLADALARRPDTSWVSVGAGGAEVTCQAMIDEERGATEGLLYHLPRTSAVLTFSAHQMLHRFAGRGEVDWVARGHELGPDQQKFLQDGASVRGESATGPRTYLITPEDEPLMRTLNRDGRASWASLAQATGWSQRQVAQRVTELADSGSIFFHLDVSHQAMGLRSVANLWFTVSPSDLASVGARLADHTELAFAAAVTGQSNLMASALCPDPENLYRYLTTKVAEISGIQTVEAVPQLTRVKQAYFLVDKGRLKEPPL